jgi:hypothetical protein
MRKFLGVSLAVGAFTILSGVAVAQLDHGSEHDTHGADGHATKAGHHEMMKYHMSKAGHEMMKYHMGNAGHDMKSHASEAGHE